MTGVLNAMAGQGGYKYLCTVVDVGGGVRRANVSGSGLITPSIPFKGATVSQCDCIGDSLGFRIFLSGASYAQNFFSRLVVQDSVGVFRTLTSASATDFTTDVGGSVWDWDVAGGTSLVWPAAGGPYLLELYP